MVRKEHNKLVRDKIPQIIGQSNCNCEVVTLSEVEYLKALGQKLIEEAQEVAIALDGSQDELIEELADLYEVIDALLAIANISREQILAKQQERREQRGGFEKRLKLLWTEQG